MFTEVCDDGNLNNNDGCNALCTGPVSGWSCTGGTTTSASTCT